MQLLRARKQMHVTNRGVRRALFAIVVLASICLGGEEDSARVRALSGKLMCNCGCGEHLSECSHKQCSRKPALRKELLAAIQEGKTDDQILEMLAAKHGDDILLTPRFRGFNALLWLVPAMAALFAMGLTFTLQKRRRAGVN